jgi:hypothetical protein
MVTTVLGTAGEGRLEIAVVGVALLLGALVLVLQARKERRLRLRRAAATGYHQRDVARYGPGAVGRSLLEPDPDGGPVLAPSFAASATGTSGTVTLRSQVPADPPPFDPVRAVHRRPPDAAR